MDPLPALDEVFNELFSASLDAFVETRTRLAAALLAAGRKEDGQSLKKVRRPSPSAWATNQVVRRARAEVDAFLAASERLRGSQGAMVSGQGDRGVYQADVEELRRVTAALAAAARRILEALGRGDDRPVVERVLANARAAALTDAGRRALLGGVLIADLDAGGDAFGGLLGGDAAPPQPPRAPSAAGAAVPAPAPVAREQRAREEGARAREEARLAALEAAKRDEAEARAAAETAAAAATRARGVLEAASARLEEAEQAVRDAGLALREAEAAHRGAARDATEAETRAGRATRRREALDT